MRIFENCQNLNMSRNFFVTRPFKDWSIYSLYDLLKVIIRFFFAILLNVEHQSSRSCNNSSFNSNISNSKKKKIVQRVLKDRCKEKIRNCGSSYEKNFLMFLHVCNFFYVHSLSHSTSHDVKSCLKETNSLTIVKVEASRFKTKPNGSLYDFTSHSVNRR